MRKRYIVCCDGAQVGPVYDSKIQADAFAEFMRFYMPQSKTVVRLFSPKESKDGDPNA